MTVKNNKKIEEGRTRRAYMLRSSQDSSLLKTEENGTVVYPCIAVEGEKGYYTTNWRWRITENVTIEDMQRILDDMNLEMGYNEKDVRDIIDSTFKGF